MTDARMPALPDVLAVAEHLLPELISRTIELSEIAAPTNDEGARAERVSRVFTQEGLDRVTTDALQNVTGRIPGQERNRCLVLAGHTDTVFPHGTDLTVQRDDDMLHGPGVGDNTVSVAAISLIKRALDHLGVTPAIDLVVAANVGEEGLGDLRGIRAITDTTAGMVGCIAVEGHSLGRVTYGAVGSRRLKVTVTGPGGHSWGRAGEPSAIHHLARIVAALDDIPLQQEPKTSFNAGLFNGGISVNTIAPEAVAVLDMRSTSPEALAELVDTVEQIIAIPAPDGITVRTEVVGDRPAGELDPNAGLSRIATDVLTEMGFSVVHDVSSTDANIPISRGIPAICIGLTTGGNAHREDEFIHTRPLPVGFAQMLVTALRSAAWLAD